MKFKISSGELKQLIPGDALLSEQKASKEEVEVAGGKVLIRVDRGKGFTYDLDVKAKEFTVSGAPSKYKGIVGARKISVNKLPKAYKLIMADLQKLYKVSSDDEVFKAAEKEVSAGAEAEKAASAFKNPPNIRSLKDKTSRKVVDAVTKALQANPKSYEEIIGLFKEKDEPVGGMSVEPSQSVAESFVRQMVKEAIRDLNEQGEMLAELPPEVDNIVDILKNKVSLDFDLGSEEGDMSTEEHLAAFFGAIDSKAWPRIKKHLETRDTVSYPSLMRFLVASHSGVSAAGKKKGEEGEGKEMSETDVLRKSQQLAKDMIDNLEMADWNLGMGQTVDDSESQPVLDDLKATFKPLLPTARKTLYKALEAQIKKQTQAGWLTGAKSMMDQLRDNTLGDKVEEIVMLLNKVAVGGYPE